MRRHAFATVFMDRKKDTARSGALLERTRRYLVYALDAFRPKFSAVFS